MAFGGNSSPGPSLGRNDAVGRAVPPHPGPLPRGEGEPFGSAIKGHRLVSFPARSKRAPSPWGEGRGEGERDVRTAWIRLRSSRGGNEVDGCAPSPRNPPRYLGGYGARGFFR